MFWVFIEDSIVTDCVSLLKQYSVKTPTNLEFPGVRCCLFSEAQEETSAGMMGKDCLERVERLCSSLGKLLYGFIQLWLQGGFLVLAKW